MRFEKEELDKGTMKRLESYGVWLKNQGPKIGREEALVLLGEAMLDDFIENFSRLWKEELFPKLRLKDFTMSEEEVRRWVHTGEDDFHDKEVVKMNPNIQGKLEGYLELLQEIKQKVDDEITARTLLQEVSKDRRMQEIREEREMKKGEPATARQLKFMKSLDIEIPAGLTKKEASVLIDEELARNNE